jgi:ATP-binding cassette, subfamily B, bacterial
MPMTQPVSLPPEQPGVFRSLARVLPYAKADLPRLGLGMLIALISSGFALAIPLTLEALVDGPLRTGNTSLVWGAAGLVALLGLLEALFVYLRRITVLTPGTRIDAKLRTAIYRHVQDLPVSFHDAWQSGQLLSRAQTDVSLVRRWMSFGLVLLVSNSITIVLGVAILFTWSPLLAGVFTLCSVPMLVFGSRFRSQFSGLSRITQDQWGDVATSVEESVHGIRILKSFGRGPDALARFTTRASRGRDLEIEKGSTLATLGFWLGWIPDFALASCLALGVWLASVGELTTGELFAFFATAAVLAGPIASIAFLLALTLEARSGLDRIFEVMDVTNTIVDSVGAIAATKGRGSLVFENVHFRHADTEPGRPDLINGINLEIQPGETMALVGVTGSGKTTVTALPARLYDVTGGRILLDGVDVRDMPLISLRERIALAFEDATLFSASVRENVLFGRHDLPDLHGLEAQAILTQALEVAEAGFVYDLPDGVETIIGEQGLSLSGGQRQRLALARAIAAGPEVLVLDDPLSALDVATEARVESALRKVLATTTALVVAHRPSTVMLADRVALLKKGRIVAVGTHTELLESSPAYRSVISSLADTDQSPREDRDITDSTVELEIIESGGLDDEVSR